jgi:hypothetical protein
VRLRQALQARLRPKLERYELTLDRTLEEMRRLAYARVDELFLEDGSLRPIKEWPKDGLQAVMTVLGLKRKALKDLLEYFRHAGVFGQPDPPATSVTVNNVTVVPLERLTDEELEFYCVLAEKGRAIPIIDVSKP